MATITDTHIAVDCLPYSLAYLLLTPSRVAYLFRGTTTAPELRLEYAHTAIVCPWP